MIDVSHNGFSGDPSEPEKFTNPDTDCVLFDMKNDGHPKCYSFPEENSRIAFLVYKDASGTWSVFGPFTPQPATAAGVKPNGMTALMQYDTNHDTAITALDPLWNRLRLWFPKHCHLEPGVVCVPLPKELHKLESAGIHSLSVVYNPDNKVDKWGNQFRYYSQVNPKPHDPMLPDDELNERRMYDVWLVEKK
jgi:hypothetical protein